MEEWEKRNEVRTKSKRNLPGNCAVLILTWCCHTETETHSTFVLLVVVVVVFIIGTATVL